MTYSFTAAVWRYSGDNPWYFVTLPFDVSDDITDVVDGRSGQRARGFGSVRVRVTVGATTWDTSLFPDSKAKSYVLPIKKQVRTSERLDDGVSTTVTISLIDR